MAKNILITYLFWLLGGLVGLHHIYLGRDEHAFVWFVTAGGCLGFGWLRELIRIPDYVADANEERHYMDELRHRSRMDPSPPFHTLRFIGELIVGLLFGFVLKVAVPEEHVAAYRLIDFLVPVAVAAGVYLVGCIGREQVSFRVGLLGAYCGLPMFAYAANNLMYPPLLATIAVNIRGKSWRLKLPRRSLCRRACALTLCGLLYTSLWGSAIYHNAYISTADGEKVKVHEAARHFFNSPAWAETKETMATLWHHFNEHGFIGLYNELLFAFDPEGEGHAYKILGLRIGASKQQITTAYRQLVREWHPDKHKDPSKKAEASAHFMKIQKAYETLSAITMRRAQRTTGQGGRADDEL